MSEDADFVPRKDALLEATLPNVVFDGWSIAALRVGAKSLGLDEIEIARLFPGGPTEAMLWLDDWADRRMLDALDRLDLAAMKVRQRVAAAVKARLDIVDLMSLTPHRYPFLLIDRVIELVAAQVARLRELSAVPQ